MLSWLFASTEASKDWNVLWITNRNSLEDISTSFPNTSLSTSLDYFLKSTRYCNQWWHFCDVDICSLKLAHFTKWPKVKTPWLLGEGMKGLQHQIWTRGYNVKWCYSVISSVNHTTSLLMINTLCIVITRLSSTGCTSRWWNRKENSLRQEGCKTYRSEISCAISSFSFTNCNSSLKWRQQVAGNHSIKVEYCNSGPGYCGRDGFVDSQTSCTTGVANIITRNTFVVCSNGQFWGRGSQLRDWRAVGMRYWVGQLLSFVLCMSEMLRACLDF